jgi:hypothetical protein
MAGSNSAYENRKGRPAGTICPRGVTTSAPTYSSSTRRSALAPVGVTRTSPGTDPDVGDADAPAIEPSVHRPSGPSTRKVSGRSPGFPAGHSFGDR